jgi:hypothetical protein
MVGGASLHVADVDVEGQTSVPFIVDVDDVIEEDSDESAGVVTGKTP